MNFDKIKELLEKVPITLLLVAYLGFLGFDYYGFENDDTSPKQIKQREINGIKDANGKLEKKIKELNEFAKALEQKKVELRGLARQLQELKTTLTENIDVPGFMKMVTTEAKKLNFSVLGLKPTKTDNHEFYSELSFELGFRGVFVQFAAFLNRLANMSRIIQIDKFKAKVPGSNSARFIIIEGNLVLKVFKYVGSREDTLGSSNEANSKSPPQATSSSPNKNSASNPSTAVQTNSKVAGNH